jgi:hypothetical protein
VVDRDPGRLPTIDVMRQLHGPVAEAVAAAEAELGQRGLTAAQIDLARQLTDPDPAIRRGLVDALPAMPGMDARPWLLWLTADAHADVRLAALTVLATSRDPELLRRVEQLASRDRDPRIAALGDRIRQHRP